MNSCTRDLMKSLRPAALDLMADVTLGRGYFFPVLFKTKSRNSQWHYSYHWRQKIISILRRRFSLPVRPRLTKQTNKLTILASLNHSCRAFHLMGQYFLAPSIVLHRTCAWASDSLSGNGSLLKKLSGESNLLLKSLMASLSLFLPVTFLAISFA